MCIINLTASGVTSLVFCNFFYNISLCSLLATSSSTTAEALRTYFLSVLLLCASASASDSTQVALPPFVSLGTALFLRVSSTLTDTFITYSVNDFFPFILCYLVQLHIYEHLLSTFTAIFYVLLLYFPFFLSLFFFLSPKWRMPSAATDLHTTTVTAAKNYRTLSSLCCHGDAAAAMVFASSLRMPLFLPPLLHATIIATPATTAIATTLFYSYYC